MNRDNFNINLPILNYKESYQIYLRKYHKILISDPKPGD